MTPNLAKPFLAVLAAGAILFSGSAHAALAVGAKAPTFAVPAALAGKQITFDLAAALKKGPVVLYFYPKAFTAGCTAEAHEFAEATPEFNTLGATVIGLSGDDIETLKRFSVSECRDKFAVGVADKPLIQAYDAVLMGDRSNRTSYVIAPDGTILLAYSALDFREHVSRTMAAVKAWKAGR